jgi:hypothetical protein
VNAGEVLETQVPNQPDGRFRLKLRIRQNLHAAVRTDSVPTIKTMGLGEAVFLTSKRVRSELLKLLLEEPSPAGSRWISQISCSRAAT